MNRTKVDEEMNDIVYDVPISEVAKILTKSDRQVRRYVKGRKLSARPVRIEGHIKLMFSREDVLAFKDRFAGEGYFGESGREIIVDAHLLDDDREGVAGDTRVSDTGVVDGGEPSAVKYVIDALREQMRDLQKETRELHYQLEQRSGQVGFLQGKVETLEEEMKMLMPAAKSQEVIVKRKPWYRRLFGRE